MTGLRTLVILSVAKRWGGGSLEERWRGRSEAAQGPSTMLCMVPVPTSCARREDSR